MTTFFLSPGQGRNNHFKNSFYIFDYGSNFLPFSEKQNFHSVHLDLNAVQLWYISH